MSFIPKKGKDSAWRKMTVRQQVSDVLSYGHIVTTKSRGKDTQRCLERIVTLSKNNSLEHIREVASVIIGTSKYNKSELLKRIFTDIADRYKDRQGGYSRLLKLKQENRVILSLV